MPAIADNQAPYSVKKLAAGSASAEWVPEGGEDCDGVADERAQVTDERREPPCQG